jgi:hypothetical protein
MLGEYNLLSGNKPGLVLSMNLSGAVRIIRAIRLDIQLDSDVAGTVHATRDRVKSVSDFTSFPRYL